MSNTLGESCGSGCTQAPTYYARGVYRGHYLNWYFSNTGGAWTSGLSKKPGTKSRMEIAKEASKGAIDRLTGVRLGLSTYNGSNGGSLLVPIGDIATNKTTVQTKIDGLSASGSTPLAETLSDIGRYFATGYTGNLTLHQGQANQATASVASVFNSHEFLNSTGGSTLAAPIQKSCQKSFAMLMTDGRPDSDRNISSSLADYDGDCTGTNASNCSGGYDMKNGQTYEGEGSDYLDDVAQALYEMDLRPNLADPTGNSKTLAHNNINNLSTYVIGFADPFVKNDPLVRATADQGGGDFFAPKNAAELSRDFDTVLGDITGKVGAAAAVAVSNPNVAAGDNTLYTSSFHSGKWKGDLIAYNITTSTGLPDLVNPVWTNGCTASQDTGWIDANDHSRGNRGCSAQLQLDNTGVVTPSTRKIVTYTGTAGTGQGLQFQPNSATTTTKLSPAQQTALNTSATVIDGANVLSFLRGDRSLEGTNYRARGSRLGDIVNAEPVVINPPFRRYGDAGYTAFKTAKASRRRVVFQAANDGMLHAFDADRTVPGSGGDELLGLCAKHNSQ